MPKARGFARFVAVNCPPSGRLLESELFGFERERFQRRRPRKIGNSNWPLKARSAR